MCMWTEAHVRQAEMPFITFTIQEAGNEHAEAFPGKILLYTFY